MTSFFSIIVILLFGLLPVAFHLHYHRRGKDDCFFLELRILNFCLWRYQIPDWQREALTNTEAEKDPEGQEKAETYLANLFELGTVLNKYGLGGTFFYLFLPVKYRKWVTVTEEMEIKGCFKRFVWRTAIGGLEPSLLGPMVGLVWSAKGMIIGFLSGEYIFKRNPRIMVVPCFTGTSLETMFDCIFEIKLGHIIFTGIRDYLSQVVGGKKHAGTPD